MSATAFQRRRRELAKENAVVVGDMTVMDREATSQDQLGVTHENQHPEVRASEAAEKLAGELAINLRQVEPTGQNSTITVNDVRRAARPTIVE